MILDLDPDFEGSTPLQKLLLLACAVSLASLGAAFQIIHLGQCAFTDSNRNSITIETKAQFAAPEMKWGQLTMILATRTSTGWLVRHVEDRAEATVTGYELRATPTAKDRFRLEFQPLREDPRQAGSKELRWTSPVSLPLNREVRRGETIRVELAQHNNAILFEEVVVQPAVQ